MPFKLYWPLLPLVLLFAYGLRRCASSPGNDFAGYYAGSREILHGGFHHAYDMESLNETLESKGYTGNYVSYGPFPPSTALVFAPFLGFRMQTAKLLFDILSCLLFVFTLLRAARFFNIPPLLVALTPFVFLVPILNNLVFGQAYLLLIVLLLEGYMAYRQDRIIAATLFWALAIVFKLTPAFLFLFLLLRKKYRTALYLGAACTILLLICMAVTGSGAWKFYISDILPKMGRGELNDPFTYVFQSAFMLLKKEFLFDALLNPHPAYQSPYLFVGSMALFKAAALSAAILATIRHKDEFFSFSVWVTVSLLISPNGSSYSLLLLLLPLWSLAERTGLARRPVLAGDPGLARRPDDDPGPSRPSLSFWLAVLLLGAACTVPVTRFGGYPVWAQFPRLYLLLAFFAVLLAQGRRLWNSRMAIGLATLFFVLDIRSYLPATDGSRYFLPEEKHLFIYDYTVRDHHLVYYYRDGGGRQEQMTSIPVATLTDDPVQLKDNQIFYQGRQVTSSPDWKQKPRLLNGNHILYLSDKGRGIGFYTLREITPGDSAAPLSYR